MTITLMDKYDNWHKQFNDDGVRALTVLRCSRFFNFVKLVWFKTTDNIFFYYFYDVYIDWKKNQILLLQKTFSAVDFWIKKTFITIFLNCLNRM